MELRREPVLFGLTLLIVGLLGWQLYDEANNPLRAPTWPKKDLEVAPIRIPDIGKVPMPAKPGASEAMRDLFAEPRDTRPLPSSGSGSISSSPTASPTRF